MNFQVGAALLDACVLAILSREDACGYVLTQNVKEILSVSESTLYPVLRRLQKESFLTTYDMPYDGRNRRYYQITDTGKEKLDEYLGQWSKYKENVDKILSGGAHDEQARGANDEQAKGANDEQDGANNEQAGGTNDEQK